MDKDNDARIVSSEDYRHAVDILNGFSERPGTAINPKGTLGVSLGLPQGENIVIGTREDKQTSSLYIFVYNDGGEHRIYRWDSVSQVVYTVAYGPALNFDRAQLINQSVVIDGRLLAWTDAIEGQGVPGGDHPKKINAIKGDLFKESIQYEVYAGIVGEGQFANGFTYRFYTLNFNGDESEIVEYAADGTFENDPAGGLEWLKGQLENDFDNIEIDLCDGCKMKVSLPQPTTGRRLQLETSNGDVILVPVNSYPLTLEGHHIDLLKQPPHCAPTATYRNDPEVSTNYVKNLAAQFRVRYIYDDNERSAWGPVSNIALNAFNGEPITLLNVIRIDFTDTRLSDPSWLSIVRAVEIAFRDGNENDWKLIKRIDSCEIGIKAQRFDFYNDKLYGTLPSDDTSTDASLQVLKPFDYAPIRSLCMETSANSDGNGLLFLGANQENYDNPDCVTMGVTAISYSDDCLVDIIGTVVIENDPNFSGDNPDFDHYPLGGIVVYLAGTPYYAISDNPADGTGDGSFRISGVPNGKNYIIRAASHRCSFTNDHGPRLNMSNALEWQRTSAPVIEMAGSGTTDNQYERLIDLTAHTPGLEFDLDSEPGYGPVRIANQHYARRVTAAPPGADSINLYEYHVLDNNSLNADNDDRILAHGCERQKVVGNARTSGLGSDAVLNTDHNGYCFDRRFHPSGAAIISGSVPVNENDYHPAFANRKMYNGGFKEMYEDTLALVTTTNSTNATQQYFIVNEAAIFTALKKTIKARATIQDGITPLPLVLFVYQRNGRQAITGIDGYVDIEYFIPYLTTPDRDDDFLIAIYLPDNCNEGNAVPALELLNLTDPIDDPYIVSVFEFQMENINFVQPRFLKGGGVYEFGIVYEDRGNRTPGAINAGTLRIPAHTDGLNKWQMQWSIEHEPPEWATHYRIVRLYNSVHSSYVQWTIPEVRYVRMPSQLEPFTETSFVNGDYTHLLFKLHTLVVDVADPETFFFQQDGQQGYVPRVGDKVRLILDEQGGAVNTGTSIYESEIVGTYLDTDILFAIVPAVFGNLEVKPGFLAEYYTPVTGVAEIYYEGGEDCYEIGEAGTDQRYHKGPLTDQVVGVSPATGKYTGGDTYWRRQQYTQTGVYETEHQTPTRFITSQAQDIGRSFALSTDVQQEFYYNRVRVSGIYIPNSAINGLSSFSASEYKDINRQWGPIMALAFANNVMLAICKFKVQPIYIGKGDLMYLSGATNVGRSDQIMEIADESITDFGTHDPGSVVVEGGSVYFWDRYNGAVCRYAQNGVVPITSKMSQFFHEAGLQHMTGRGYAIAGFDRRHQLYVLTLIGMDAAFQEKHLCYGLEPTVAYDEIKGGWVTEFPITPEYFGRVGLEFVSFKAVEDGDNMWLHYKADDRSNYYGEQHKMSVSFVGNQSPGQTKIFRSLRIVATKKMEAPIIRVPFNNDYQAGMLSLLKPGHVFSYEGQWRADLLRDMTDTDPKFNTYTSPEKEARALLSGRLLRGESIEIKLQVVDGAEDTELSRADVYFIPSQRSHP